MLFNFKNIQTPFYYYDLDLLDLTLGKLKTESQRYNYKVHYALKANSNNKILKRIVDAGFGADCVSGNEILAAIEAGFSPKSIVFAGVGKTDEEIMIGLTHNIACFNCESIAELQVINELAGTIGKTANVALRINPEVDANTHKFITTGTSENKFGINYQELPTVIDLLGKLKNIELRGLHFHIGSQIMDLNVFKDLCLKVNTIQNMFVDKGICLEHINLGGGLGVDYHQPLENSIPDFEGYFNTIHHNIKLQRGQELHVELGRSVVAQSGSLFTKVLYVKEGNEKKFAVVDAGMTELIRPALYSSFHKIENLDAFGEESQYDVVGPICETSDFLGENVQLPPTKRGDLLQIYTCGAYGEVMASSYNLRKKANSYYSDCLICQGVRE